MQKKYTHHENFFKKLGKGFVYVLTHPHMDCVKIGCSGELPHNRADQLSSAKGVPGHFQVAHAIVADDMFTVERVVKDEFKDKHICKEFYEVAAYEVIKFIDETWPGAQTALMAEKEFMEKMNRSAREPKYRRSVYGDARG